MNRGYRNVVFIGFTKEEQQEVKIIDTRKLKTNWHMIANHLHRFPYVLYFENIEEGLKHQGFAIFIKNTKKNEEYLNKHLKKLNSNYYYVILCTENKSSNKKYETICEQRLFEETFFQELNSWYYKYLQEENKNQEIIRKININSRKGKIATNIKKYFEEKDNITAKEVAVNLNIPLRTAQRYIKYTSEIYDNIFI